MIKIKRWHYVYSAEAEKYEKVYEEWVLADNQGTPLEIGDRVAWVHNPSRASSIVSGVIEKVDDDWVYVKADNASRDSFAKNSKGTARLDTSIGHIGRPLPYGQSWALHRILLLD